MSKTAPNTSREDDRAMTHQLHLSGLRKLIVRCVKAANSYKECTIVDLGGTSNAVGLRSPRVRKRETS